MPSSLPKCSISALTHSPAEPGTGATSAKAPGDMLTARQANCQGSTPAARRFQSEYRPGRLTTMRSSRRRSIVAESASGTRAGIGRRLQRNSPSPGNTAHALTIFSVDAGVDSARLRGAPLRRSARLPGTARRGRDGRNGGSGREIDALSIGKDKARLLSPQRTRGAPRPEREPDERKAAAAATVFAA